MSRAAPPPAPPWLAPSVFAVTAAAYISTAAPDVHWLDSGELAGAAATLGVAHPPGHPVYVLAGQAATWAPLGSVGFRASLLSALMAALAAAFTALLAHRTALAAGGRAAPPSALPSPRAPTPGSLPAQLAGLAAGLVSGLATGWWLQAVRPEVYTLHLALTLGATLAVLRWRELTPPDALAEPAGPTPRGPGRPALLGAAALVGLAAGNHHYLLLFHVPCLLVLAWGRRRALARALPAATAVAAAALVAYALLPLRAAHEPAFDFGAPDTWGRLLDVVTARVFQASVGAPGADVATNLLAASGMLFAWLGASLLLAPAGMARLLRGRRVPPDTPAGGDTDRRTLGIALAVGVAGNLASKVLMALDPSNPDAAGYFALSVALVAALAAPAVAWLVEAGTAALGRVRVGSPWAAAAAAAAITLALLAGVVGRLDRDRVDLTANTSPALVDAVLTRRMLPDAVIMPSHYALHFNRLYQSTVQGVRPDLLAVQQGLGAHVGGGAPLAARLRTARPALGPALDAFAATGGWPERELLALAAATPLYVEPTLLRLFPPETVRYGGGYLRVRPRGAPGAGAAALEAQRQDERALARALGSVIRRDPELRKTLLLLWLSLAATELRGGPPEAAAEALAFADWLSPSNPYTERLRPAAAALAEAQARGDAATLRRLRARLAPADMTHLFE